MSEQSHLDTLLDEVIDRFEQAWTPDDSPIIEELVGQLASHDENKVIVELIRVDIDKRYEVGATVSLGDYFARFPKLLDCPEHCEAVVFEDFRSRSSRGLECSAERWANLPFVISSAWFLDLARDSKWSRVRDIPKKHPPTYREGVSESFGLGNPMSFPEVGRVLGDFELLGLLGEGAFSRVFLAQQRSLASRFVAVKVVSRPLHEPANLARLQHTGIVPLYSFHRIEPWCVLCMPYAGSTTLADWLKRESTPSSRTGQSLVATIRDSENRITQVDLPERSRAESAISRTRLLSLEAWNSASAGPLDSLRRLDANSFCIWFFRRIAAALAHAHQRGVVHGDLKPANILVRNDGEPALIDFNLSQAMDTGTVAWLGGTLPYMAPEQLQAFLNRSPIEARPTADVYSLATIVFEMIEGTLPFPTPVSAAGADLAIAVDQRLRNKPRFRTSSRLGLKAIVAKCLAIDPCERYPSAVELLEDIELESANRPLRHCPESLWRSRLPKFVARHPKTFSAASVATVALLAIVLTVLSALSYRERASRLTAIEELTAFDAASAAALASFLVADESSATNRMQLIRAAFKSYRLDEGENLSAWRASNAITRLTSEELHSVEERLLALVYFSAKHASQNIVPLDSGTQHASGETANIAWLSALMDSLPEWAERTFAFKRIANHSCDQPIEMASVSQAELPIDRLLLSYDLLTEGRFDEAQSILSRSGVVNSLAAAYWLTLGRAQLGSRDLNESILSFSLAIRESPTSAIGYMNRGLAYLSSGDSRAAERDFTTAIDLEPRSVAALVNRNFAFSSSGKHEQALADLDAAITLEPTSNRLLLLKSRVLKQVGRTSESQECFQRALRARPHSVVDWVSLALARLPSAPAQALADLKQAEASFGPDPMILQSMAHVMSEQLGEIPSAIDVLSRILERKPGFAKALGGRAVLYARMANCEAAEKDIESLKSLPQKLLPESQYQIACAYSLCSPQKPEFKRLGLRYLAIATQRGYDPELLDTDPDIEFLRETPEFHAIQESIRLAREK